MLDSIGKFASFLTISGLAALAILLHYRKRIAAEHVALNVEVFHLHSTYGSHNLPH